MFKLQPNPTFTARVGIPVPGEKRAADISVTFRHFSRDEIKYYFDGLEGKTDIEALSTIITGWDGVDTPYTEEALSQLLDNYPASAAALFEAFRRELLDARAKN